MTTRKYQPTNPSDRTGLEYKQFLDEIDDELPNQNYATDDDTDESHLEDGLDSYTSIPVNTRQAYAAKKSKEQHLKQHLQKAHDEALNEYIKANPDSQNLKVRTSHSITAKPEGTINFNAAYAAFMSCFLDRNQNLKTQKAILEYVKRETGIQALTANFWNLSLRRFNIKTFEKRIAGEGLNISLSGCSTLSDVRKACSAYFTRSNAALKTIAKVSLGEGMLVINNVSHRIMDTSAGDSSYQRIKIAVGDKRVWLRLDALEQLLFNKKSKN